MAKSKNTTAYKNEAALNEHIIDEITSKLQGFATKIYIDPLFSTAGIPDIYACIDSKSLWIESKVKPPTTLKGRPTPIQYMVMRKIQNAGGVAFCARCWEDVYAYLYGEMIVNFEVLYPQKKCWYLSYGYVKTENKWDEFISNVRSGAYLPEEIDL